MVHPATVYGPLVAQAVTVTSVVPAGKSYPSLQVIPVTLKLGFSNTPVAESKLYPSVAGCVHVIGAHPDKVYGPCDVQAVAVGVPLDS
mmetsp:Transcript_14218/g.34559  ORF Transcript_14218/g.34559 Transcript_14218/m.34559 type:complete len:88 (-) Transcript_14218:1024-1287(-)